MLRLHLYTRPESEQFVTRSLFSVSSDRLWRTASTEGLHLTLRRPSIHELARRQDSRVLDLAEKLVNSHDIEKWFLGLETLTLHGGTEVIDRMLRLCIQEDPVHRRIILSHVAIILEERTAPIFKRYVRDLVSLGVIDVTGWSDIALHVVRSECKRLGIGLTGNLSPKRLPRSDEKQATKQEIGEKVPILSR